MENQQAIDIPTMGVPDAVKKVVLRAPVLSQSGYGVHSRQIARWLLSRPDIDLIVHPVQWGITPWYLDATAQDGLIGEIMSRSRDDKGPFDVSVQVQLPNEWSTDLAKKNIGVTAGVETTICNPAWVTAVNAMDHVIVPSSFVKSTFERTGVLANNGANVSVVPESFIDSIVHESLGSTTTMNVEFDTIFNFLLIGQMTGRSSENDRKNIFNTLKWFCETFSEDKDVGLVLKTNSGRESKIDRLVTVDIIKQVLSLVRKGPYPKVHLLHGIMSDADVASLYRHPSIKALITLTRGEGFGLPILEAAASGVPVIATNWSGHMDFMKLGKFVKVDFELKQIPKSRVDNNIFVSDAKWAEVSETDVKRRLEKFRRSPDVPKEWALELKDKLLERFSYDAIKPMYDAIWEKLRV